MKSPNKKSTILITCLLMLGIAFSIYAQENKKKDQKAKNLKVIPKDISHEDLDKQMDFFCASLNVKCNYCHANSLTRPGKLDFASDSAARHKEDGRRMLELTYSINEKYFGIARTEPMSTHLVNCYTCHRGEEFPTVIYDSVIKKDH